MGTWTSLYLLPEKGAVPSRLRETVAFLTERLGVEASADPDKLTAALSAAKPRREVGLSFPGEEAFAFDLDAEDPDLEGDWIADQLSIIATEAPYPYWDWEGWEGTVRCPKCRADAIKAIFDRFNDEDHFSAPLPCRCGARNALTALVAKPPIRLSKFAVRFGPEKGWIDDGNLRKAFKDAAFLPDFEKRIGSAAVLVRVQR